MTTAIMQPTYLPWAGYFNLIHRASRFVFLNDVQFAKPSWQMRNRVLLQGQVQFLSVPTLGSRNQKIHDVRLASDEFRSKHRRRLEHAYGKHPYGPELLDCVLPVLGDVSLRRLEELNLGLIFALCRRLQLRSEFVCSHELALSGRRSAHLVNILEIFGEHDYLSPPGSAEYIAEDALLERAGIRVEFQHFSAYAYPQRGAREFEPRLSIVDVVAHLGFEVGRKYVTQELAPESLLEPAGCPRLPETPAPAPHA